MSSSGYIDFLLHLYRGVDHVTAYSSLGPGYIYRSACIIVHKDELAIIILYALEIASAYQLLNIHETPLATAFGRHGTHLVTRTP